jgi:hypothetical protein
MPIRPAVPAAFSTVLIAALSAAFAPAAAHADEPRVQVHIHCSTTSPASTRCPPPPAPPAPPKPPAAPQPLVPDADGRLPPPPPVPAPPPVVAVPPVPEPKLPAIPAAAHAACAGKTEGSALTWKLGPNETMGGVCTRRDGKMVFQLRSYDLQA